jgi:hypothetical protein
MGQGITLWGNNDVVDDQESNKLMVRKAPMIQRVPNFSLVSHSHFKGVKGKALIAKVVNKPIRNSFNDTESASISSDIEQFEIMTEAVCGVSLLLILTWTPSPEDWPQFFGL